MRNLVFAFMIVALAVLIGCVPTVEKVESVVDVRESVVEPTSQAIKEPKPAIHVNGASPSIQEETTEKGGPLQDWQETISQTTGSESEESKTVAECASLMSQKVAECSKHPAWSVVNAMEITDFRTDKHYEFQDVKRQDCSTIEDVLPEKIHVDTSFLDAQTDNTRVSSYQVVCSVNCQWWECDENDLSGTWEGTYTEISGSKYCQFKEVGSKTFKIKMIDDKSFSGTAQYSGQSNVIGGEHCEGGASSGTGAISGSISGKQISGIIVYSSKVPFTATLEGDSLSGTYSYSTSAYGSLQKGAGEFKLNRKK
ncbi:MAG: hypothetical protein HY363_06385 [Candidatus Aenigmarchaeota archaeon]|nr:hypothetical protein [Candidatus Aenigmarchaeota archaeon]